MLEKFVFYSLITPLLSRYVMLGNHRDAWGFGAVDPSSGTAQLIEVNYNKSTNNHKI